MTEIDTESILSEATSYYSDNDNILYEILDELNIEMDDIVENCYYLGIYSFSSECNNNIISYRISLTVFYKYSETNLIDCIQYQNPFIDFSNINCVDIIQVFIRNEYYVAVVKTFWIKLIQRTWKRVFAMRKRVIENRTTLASIKYKELRGIYPHGLNVLPSVYGMLSIYS